MTSIIIDDDPLSIQVLELLIKKYKNLELLKSFTDPLQALDFLQNHSVDVVFIDIEMPGINGMELIRSLTEPPAFICTTAHTNHAHKAFDYNVVDYLVKPVTFERLLQAIDKVKKSRNVNQTTSVHEDSIFVKANNQAIRLLLSDILFFEADDDYVKIEALSGKYYLSTTMKELEENLSGKGFARIHRSYMIPLNKVERIINNTVIIKTHKLPISNTYKSSLLSKINLI